VQTPDFTPAQIVAGFTAILGALVVLFKLDLSDAQQAAFTTIIATLVPVGFFVADAIIRHGRARNAENIAAAKSASWSSRHNKP
jgi:hypothetical protein